MLNTHSLSSPSPTPLESQYLYQSIIIWKFCRAKLIYKFNTQGPHPHKVTDYDPITFAYCCFEENQVFILLLTYLMIFGKSLDHPWASVKWKTEVDVPPTLSYSDQLPWWKFWGSDLASQGMFGRSLGAEMFGWWDPN